MTGGGSPTRQALLWLVLLTGCATQSPIPSSSSATADPSPLQVKPPSASTSLEISPAVIAGIDPDDAVDIVRTALEFDATRPAHDGRDYDVTEVEAVGGETFGGSGRHARVVIEFTEPIDPAASGWPDEVVCAIGRQSDDITGIAWLLSFETGAVEAYSPQWDYGIDCVPPGSA